MLEPAAPFVRAEQMVRLVDNPKRDLRGPFVDSLGADQCVDRCDPAAGARHVKALPELADVFLRYEAFGLVGTNKVVPNACAGEREGYLFAQLVPMGDRADEPAMAVD